MSKDIAIKVENVSKVYKLYDKQIDRLKESINPFSGKYHQEFFALQDMNFVIEKGETVGIIGKNGSGKSTVLKLITGVLTPTTGEIEVNGKISALLELGAGFNPEFTGMENIYLSCTIMGYSKAEIAQRVPDILSFADIGEFVYQPVKMYSSGMFARLAFAVAINVDPDILIVDEALAVGDITFQAKCYKKFREFKEAGKTILFVTHAMDSVLRYCSRAIVLNSGSKVAEGNPKEMVDIYKKLLVKCDETGEEKLLRNQREDAIYWKDQCKTNENVLDYGSKQAEIIDYGIFDEEGNPAMYVHTGDIVSFKMKVRFNQTIQEPIFALSIKDIKGNELTGTNTLYEDIETGVCRAGDEVVTTFTQTMNLRSGSYMISLGCTAYEGEELVIYHRLYDVLFFQAISLKTVVGMFDFNSQVEVAKLL